MEDKQIKYKVTIWDVDSKEAGTDLEVRMDEVKWMKIHHLILTPEVNKIATLIVYEPM